MPYPKFPFPEIEPEYLKELSNILSLSQNQLDKLYKCPMDNEDRNNIFGKNFGESFHSTCDARFEFLDIFVEHGCHLDCHLNYKNDGREGYSFGASYSYLIERKQDGLLYHVIFIMCTRNVCGSFMEELKEVT